MDDLTAAYLEHCARDHQPANTTRTRARTLRSVGNAGTATRDEIEAWWWTRADLSARTRANDLANLRAFYRWCKRWEHRDDNPTLRLDAPKVGNSIPRPLSRSDLLKALDTFPDDLRRAVCLGAYAGLRVSEAAELNWAEVNTETGRLTVFESKGVKSRSVRVSYVLLDQLLPDTGGNVVTAGGRPYSPAVLQRKVNRALQRVSPGATFHRLRHRYGVMAYQATGDLLAVGKQMGHSSPVTTAIYAEASTEVAARIAEAVVR